MSTRWDHLEQPGVKPNSVWGRKQEMGPLEVGRFRAYGGSNSVSQTHRCLCCSLKRGDSCPGRAQSLYRLTLGTAGQLLFCP